MRPAAAGPHAPIFIFYSARSCLRASLSLMHAFARASPPLCCFATMHHSATCHRHVPNIQVKCTPNQHIINQGEIGDVLYVVESGCYEAFLRAKGEEPVQEYHQGELFGELALMYNSAHTRALPHTHMPAAPRITIHLFRRLRGRRAASINVNIIRTRDYLVMDRRICPRRFISVLLRV